MATKNTDFRNSQADNAASKFNRLSIRTSGGVTTLVTFNITWGAAAAGVVSVASTPITAAAVATGTAAEARLHHSTGPDEISGITVTLTSGGGNIELTNLSIESAQDVNLDSFTFTEPASTA